MTLFTIFWVEDSRYKVEGAGQETVKSIKKQFPRHTSIILQGFEINGKFYKCRF